MSSDDWMADDVPSDSALHDDAAPCDWLEESEGVGTEKTRWRTRRSRGPWEWLSARQARGVLPVPARRAHGAETSAISNGFRPGHDPAALSFGNALFGFVLVGVLALTMVLASVPVKAGGGEVWAFIAMSMIVQLASCTIVLWLEHHDLAAGKRFPVAYPWAGMVIAISMWLLTAHIVEQL